MRIGDRPSRSSNTFPRPGEGGGPSLGTPPERGLLAAAVVLVVCCAGPVLAGGGVLAAVTGFVSGAWWLLTVAAVLCMLALIGLRHRSHSAHEEF